MHHARQRRPGGRPLEAELRAEPRPVAGVDGVVLPVPHVPDVHGAVPLVVGVAVVPERVRAGGRVRPRRVELRDDAGQQLAVVQVAPGAAPEPPGPAPVDRAPGVLVVAVPEHERRVRAEPGDVLAGLGLDLGAHRLVLAVGRAREREVLPHEQAALVGEVVQVVGLVDAAAPHAQQVDVRLQRVVHPTGVPVAVDPGEEGVVGDPVGAAHEHGLAVDLEQERRPGLVGRGVQLDGAEADPAAPLGRVGPARRGHLDVVQRLVAVPGRPPAPHVGHEQLHRRGRGARGDGGGLEQGALAAGRGERDGHGHRLVGPDAVALDLHVHGEQSVVTAACAGQHVHERAHRRDPYARPRVEPDRLPDAGAGDVDAPVPPERARHLAQLVVLVVVGGRQVAVLLGAGGRLGHRGGERHDERVLALAQRLAHVPPEGPVHVLRAADLDAVERHRRHRVQAVGDQVVAGGVARRPVERRRVPPRRVADPLLGGLVVAVERLVDQPVAVQVEVRLARHDGGDARGERRPGAVRGVGGELRGGQRPAVVQGAEGRGDVRHRGSFVDRSWVRGWGRVAGRGPAAGAQAERGRAGSRARSAGTPASCHSPAKWSKHTLLSISPRSVPSWPSVTRSTRSGSGAAMASSFV